MRLNHVTLIVTEYERSTDFYRGLAFEQDPTDMPYLWREARLKDPDGHDIRLYVAGENRLDPPWKVESAP